MGTDQDWEKWGSSDPYFGVVSDDRFRQQNLSVQSRAEFFRTGEHHVDMIFDTIHKVFDSEFAPRRTLDFGCGVGRLLIPFARRKSRVVGADVSRSMLKEAQSNCDRYRDGEVVLVVSDDSLSAVKGEFDLVHSFLVLQHIPWRRGKRLIDGLLNRVSPGGVIAIQFYYHCNASRFVRALVRLRYASSTINILRNIWRRRSPSEPAMQLHVYNLSWVMRRLRRSGFGVVHQRLGEAAGGEFEDMILFAKRGCADSGG